MTLAEELIKAAAWNPHTFYKDHATERVRDGKCSRCHDAPKAKSSTYCKECNRLRNAGRYTKKVRTE